MKSIPIARFILTGLFVGSAAAQHQTAVRDPPVTGGTLPYEITLREISLAPAAVPTLHSAVAAVWLNQWVLLAGTTNGLHGMTGNTGFDPKYENREVWVIDPVTRQCWHKSLVDTSSASGLSADAVDSLSSVNTEFHEMETSTDLVVWQELGDPIPGQAATMQWQEPMNGSRRFYRIFDGFRSKTPEP